PTQLYTLSLHDALPIFAVSGHYAYVTASYAHRLTIIDILDPLQPVIVRSVYDPSQLAVPVDVAVAGGYAFVANETISGRVTVVRSEEHTSELQSLAYLV